MPQCKCYENLLLVGLVLNLATSCTSLFVKTLQGCDVKWKTILFPFSLPSPGKHSLSLSLFCLSSRLSLSLWAVAGSSQRKWCSPSGVVVNMLSRERASGRGHMKTSYALNPQQNPGVHYNGENHFGGKRLERQQSCGKCFWDNRETTLFSSG